MQKEAQQKSQFDPLKLKENVWDNAEMFKCKASIYARIIYIVSDDDFQEPPWDLWSRIFQWLGHPANSTQQWRVFWFPSSQKRVLPSLSSTKQPIIGPDSVNGGYCFPCKHDSIVVYRDEEATRVLIHEILHAACLDNVNESLQFREATTEVWAELFLVALLSEGDENKLIQLWGIQSMWIANQNALLENKYNIKSPSDYVWRYTVGRNIILHLLNIKLPKGDLTKATNSGRLTSPEILY